MPEILCLRHNTTGVYFEFLEYFVSSVTGKNHFKYHRCDKLLSEYVTVCDEALAILIFENNIDTWKDLYLKNITKNSTVRKKYTNGGSSKGDTASSRKYQGWSSEGIDRFNELFDLVKADRSSAHADSFEVSFQAYCKTGGALGKGKKAVQPLMPSLKIRHTLWEDDDDDKDESEFIDAAMSMDELAASLKTNTGEDVEEMDEDEDPFGVKINNAAV